MQGLRQCYRRTITPPSCPSCGFPDVDKTVEKRARSKNHVLCYDMIAVSELNAYNSVSVSRNITHLSDDEDKVRLFRDQLCCCGTVYFPVRLGTRALYRWTFTAIQQSKLNTGRVSQARHNTIQGVDFADKMTLAQSADGRITGQCA